MAKRRKIVEIVDTSLEQVVNLARAGETVVLSRDGEPAAVLMSVTAIRQLTEERELLRRLALGELESAGGEGDELEAVLSDCRLLLEEN